MMMVTAVPPGCRREAAAAEAAFETEATGAPAPTSASGGDADADPGGGCSSVGRGVGQRRGERENVDKGAAVSMVETPAEVGV